MTETLPTHVERHLLDLYRRRPELQACDHTLREAYVLLRELHDADGTFYVCGNGGSAADAEHWCGELLKSFETRRHGPKLTDSLPAELHHQLEDGFRAIPLTGFTSLRSAVANDTAAEVEYAQLVWVLARAADVVCGISTSGNSTNVCLALKAARARGARTLVLTGQDGGQAAELADVAIQVPARRTLEVQEFHLPVYHTLSLMLEDGCFGTPLSG